jgi:hypothetical protein
MQIFHTVSRLTERRLSMKKNLIFLLILVLSAGMQVVAAASIDSIATLEDKSGYKIEKPGTITFTVGVLIKGKAEKPQVVIFLPKEKPFYEPMNFDRSFVKDIMKPLPLAPVVE